MTRIADYINEALKSERVRIVTKESGKAVALGAITGIAAGFMFGPKTGMATGAFVATSYGVSKLITAEQLLGMISKLEKLILEEIITGNSPKAIIFREIVMFVTTVVRTYNLKLEYY